jgi:hypothetical protein
MDDILGALEDVATGGIYRLGNTAIGEAQDSMQGYGDATLYPPGYMSGAPYIPASSSGRLLNLGILAAVGWFIWKKVR